MNRRLAAVFLLTAAAVRPVVARADSVSVIGDRLVLAVNGVPYTQREVEAYVTVKESLRRTEDSGVRLIGSRNWPEALGAFAEDTVVLQEAQRLGSYAAPDQALDKFLGVVREKAQHNADLQATLARLGVDEPTLTRTLEDVLRVAAFRRSKDRQESQASQALGARGAAHATGKSGGRWLAELTDRAIVRRFQGADAYVVIHPRGGDGR